MKLSGEKKTKPVKHLPEVWALFSGGFPCLLLWCLQKQSDTMTQNSCLFAKKNTRCLGPESSIHEIASRKNKFLNGLPLKDSSFHSLVTTPNGNGITLLKNSQHLCLFFPDLKGTKSVDETRPRPYPQRNPGLEKSFSLQDTHWISRILPSNLANNPDPWFWR